MIKFKWSKKMKNDYELAKLSDHDSIVKRRRMQGEYLSEK